MADGGDGRPQIRLAADGRRIYEAGGANIAAFLLDRSEIAVIRGPWASGTSVACCQRIFQHAVEQHHDSRGKRRSRWFAIRESYPKIETTTLATWTEWFRPNDYGKLYTGSKPYHHEVRVGDIELDMYFLSVDDLQNESVFLSLEPTGLWWNELEYASMKMFFAAHGRVGRYPALIEGGSRWSGTIADLNAPSEAHWLPMLTGEVELPEDMPLDERIAYQRPKDMAYFVQPPAVVEVKGAKGERPRFVVNPQAENLKFLEAGYYERAMIGKTARWIRSRLGNQIIPIVEGDPVWPNYEESVHLSPVPLVPMDGEDVWIGMDFGRKPFALFGQRIGRVMNVQFEAGMKNAGAARFAPEVRNVLAKFYPWTLMPGGHARLHIFGDPKGQDGTQTDETTAYDVFRANGLVVRPAPVKQNNIRTRIEVVEYALDRRTLLISPRCRRLKMAMAGGYRFPPERPSPLEERKPIKDHYCLPLRAEAMTPLGWKRYDDLSPGDAIYTLNEAGDLSVGEVEQINVFPGMAEVIRFTNADTAFEATPAHRHVVQLKSGQRRIVTADKIMDGHAWLSCAPEDRGPKERGFSDSFISIAAWVMAEGSYRRQTAGITITQSASHNPAYCERIDGLLKSWPASIERSMSGDKRVWYIRQELAWLLRKLMPDKCPSPEFITAMSNSERRLFLFEFMRGDGCFRHKTDARMVTAKPAMPESFGRSRDVFGGYASITAFAKRADHRDALQIIGTLAGVPIRYRKLNDGWEVRICMKRLKMEPRGMVRETVETDGVWCPTTDTGNWVCRLDGQTFITGNSEPADSLQYLELGAGEGMEMIGRGGSNRSQPVSTRPRGGVLRRMGVGR